MGEADLQNWIKRAERLTSEAKSTKNKYAKITTKVGVCILLLVDYFSIGNEGYSKLKTKDLINAKVFTHRKVCIN